MSTIIVGIVVLACLGIAAKHIYKLFHGETSCCGTEQPKENFITKRADEWQKNGMMTDNQRVAFRSETGL